MITDFIVRVITIKEIIIQVISAFIYHNHEKINITTKIVTKVALRNNVGLQLTSGEKKYHYDTRMSFSNVKNRYFLQFQCNLTKTSQNNGKMNNFTIYHQHSILFYGR